MESYGTKRKRPIASEGSNRLLAIAIAVTPILISSVPMSCEPAQALSVQKQKDLRRVPEKKKKIDRDPAQSPPPSP